VSTGSRGSAAWADVARPPAGASGAPEAAGWALFGGLAAWTALAAVASGGDPRPAVATIMSAGVAVAGAALVSSRVPWLVPAAVMAIATFFLVAAPGEVASSEPLSGPFGYANATGAFYAQAVVAALMLVALTPRPTWKWGAAAVALVFAWVTLATESRAALTLVVSAPVVALIGYRIRGARGAAAACAVSFLVGLTVTIVAAVLFSGVREGPFGRSVTERRLALWNEALGMMAERPVTGVGPGRFAAVSEIAQADRDARWAHHGFLQHGAETGPVGMVLLVLVFLWGFRRLAAARRSALLPVFGSAALVAMGVHASVDYIFHFPAVVVAGAALVGAGMGTARESVG